ncbi:MAG: hypothetical protein A3G18_13445 [Rhodospirillales bacterium RIFCSPLOWO2_12_FULL_58_28]|nr:MAG: hypothetical protein A3H92_13300 [Rhodospirillales bacterium RIFCSPLOWO2_02_FULL_58_16]OHC78577.1 MAG: hypothetical protein A3G18_13445 [Rhodospirillales bacterium RIFCSPLOWO2_12_FULL_58_28]
MYQAMKISDISSGKAIARTGKTKKSSGKSGLFAERLKEAAGAAEAPEAVEPTSVANIESVLAAQESPNATDQRSRGLTMNYGDGILDSLENIRRDVLLGSVPKEKLAGLAQTMRAHRSKNNDPKLNEIINEIELRAEVEIAKLTCNILK